MNGTIFYRADYELVGRVIAEKLRRRTECCDFDDGVKIVPSKFRSPPKVHGYQQ